MPQRIRKVRACSSRSSRLHGDEPRNSEGTRKVRVHGRDYKNRSDFNGERDTDEDSLDGFIVKDSLADRYVHRPDLSPEDEFSCATGFTGDELNENDRKNDNARGTRFSSTVPLYTLFKDKVIISEGGPKGSSVQEDKKEADAALSKLMEEVFYDLDSELRKITAKGMRGQGGIEDDQHNPEKEAAQAPRTGDRTPETRSPISGSCQMEISTPGNNQPSTKYHSDREDDFEDEEFDSYLLARMVEIERQSVVGGGPLGRAVLSDRAEAHAAPTGLPPQHRPAEGPDLSNGLGTGRITAFYIDALEKDGNIYLFCKQGSESLAVSTCILVKNFSRDLFFLPAKYRTDSAEANSPSEAELLDVRAEVEAVLRKHGIYDYSLRVAKKKYCFSHTGVPREAEYLVVSYPYTQHPLPRNITGRTFSNVFGLGLPAVQLFLLKSGLIGPSWIFVDDYSVSKDRISWCARDLVVDDYKSIKLPDGNASGGRLAAPPLSVMVINFFTTVGLDGNIEIVAASCRGSSRVYVDNLLQAAEGSDNYAYAALCVPEGIYSNSGMAMIPSNKNASKLMTFNSESSLIEYIISLISSNDPDIIIGHDITRGSLDTLINSLKSARIENWSAVGRLRQTEWPKVELRLNYAGLTYGKRQLIGGRIFCDTRLAAENTRNFRSYDLENLALEILDVDISKNCNNGMIYSYDTSSILDVAHDIEMSTKTILEIAEKLSVLPLTLQLANIYGNLWSRSISGTNSDGNEHFLLHEFYKRGYILPDKAYSGDDHIGSWHASGNKALDCDNEAAAKEPPNLSRRKPAYAGGLVLEPTRGLYNTCVLLLDFNSLYPSIIQEYNICFTTVTWNDYEDDPERLDTSNISPEPGVLPELVRVLVERRRQIKSFMNSKDISHKEMKKCSTKQKAFKLAANSMYGCLGFKNSRFYARPLASLITSIGRKALKDTVDIARSLDLNVIYGDTDSIMILTKTKNYYEALKVGNNLKKIINQKYSHIEIEVEAVISKILLYKKKKYACRAFEEKRGAVRELGVQVRGLEVVRREWCDLVHDSSRWILEHLLSDLPRNMVIENIKDHLREISRQAKSGEISLEKFIIRKTLSKDPESYPDKNSQPHVLVALSLKTKGIIVRAKDTIPYVICNLPDQNYDTFCHRALHYDEALRKKLEPDYTWYFSSQLLPSISRLLEVVEGINTECVAECLGLDTKKYASSAGYPPNSASPFQGEKSLNSTFGAWTVSCKSCMKDTPFPGAVYWKGGPSASDRTLCLGTECPNPGCKGELSLQSVSTSLHLFIRKCIRKYASAWAKCDDQFCTSHVNIVSVYGGRCPNSSCAGLLNLGISSEQLCKQLGNLRDLVSTTKMLALYSSHKEISEALRLKREYFDCLESIVQRYLDVNSFRFINIGSVLSRIQECSDDTGIDISVPYP